jgi:4-hydroxy-tetrahydrodipicolinate reductase
MIKLIVFGAEGKIGSNIIDKVKELNNIKLSGAIVSPRSNSIGKKVNEEILYSSNIISAIKGGEVIVDFSKPEASLKNLKKIKDKEVSYVLGTTGFKDEEEINKFSKFLPLFYTHNYAYGMNIFWDSICTLAQSLKDYDIEIINFNGREKKDSPSGTAYTAAKKIAAVKDIDLSNNIIFGREKKVSNKIRNENLIAIHSLRGGSYKSEHKVIFAGNGETIEILHREESLNALLDGIIKAIEFIENQSSGFYDMNNLLYPEK